MFLLLLCVASANSFAQSPSPNLSPDELAWRREHPVVRVGVFVGDHLPAESWSGGRPEGLGVDYARLVASRVGLRLEFHPFTSWEGVVFPAPSQPPAFDLLLGQAIVADRESRFHYLRPYASGRMVMVARKGDEDIRNEEDLAHARVAVERQFRLTTQVLSTRFPEARLVFADDGGDAMDLVARGEADAYVGSTPARTLALLRRRAADDLSLIGPLNMPPTYYALAVRADRPMLARVLGKAEATVTPAELAKLRLRWGVQNDPMSLPERATGLSAEERKWLSGLPTLRMGYEVDRYPYTFIDGNGKFGGIAAEYADIVGRTLGLRLQMVPASDWNSLQRMVRAHDVDLVAAAAPEDFQGQDVRLSRPYERFPEVIVTRLHGPPISGPDDLAGRAVAAREEAGLLPRLRTLLDNSRLIPVGSNEAGLEMVANGRADAYIGTLPAIDSLIRDRYAATLRIVGPAGLDQDLAIGVRNEYAPLLPLIDRVLLDLGEDQTRAIRGRWLTAEYRYSQGVPWDWVLGGAAIVSIVLTIVGLSYLRQHRASQARAAAERELELQLRFQQALLENIPYPVFVKDAAGRYLALNKAYEATFGYDRSRLIGQTLAETRHLQGVDSEALHLGDLALLRSGGVARRELSMRAADGTPRDMLLWLHTFERAPGEGGLLGTVVDVTEIRAAEARARESEQRLTDITRALPSAVFQIRVHRDGSRQFTYLAGDTLGTFGLTPEQIMRDESQAFARIHPDDRELTARMVAAAASTMTPMSAFDVRVEAVDGQRWIRTAGGEPKEGADGAVEWSGYWIDTTRMHEQEAALRAAKAQAEAAVEARGAFLAMMSHEIRTPMAGVLGLIELTGRTQLDAEQAHMLSMAQDSASALLQILDDILDFSRIESGRLELEVAPFDVRSLADSIVGLSAVRAHEKGIRLYSVLDWRLAAEFAGDAVRIRQVITNLLSNALKFTHSGHVELSIELAGEEEGAQLLRIAVTDTGIGIPDEQLSRLFQPFTQAEASTTRRFGGTGLGLAICRRLATLMHGSIHLESAPEVGTRAIFELTLPVAKMLEPHPEFVGKTAVVCTQDGMFVRELSNAMSALGFNLIESDVQDLHDFSEEDAALLVLDRALLNTPALPDGIPRMLLTNIADIRGFHIEDGEVVLCSNPLLWRSAVGACQAAFGLSSQAEAASLPGREKHVWRVLVAEDHPINLAVIGRQLEGLGYAHDLVENGEQARDALQGHHYDLLITDCHMPKLDGYTLTRWLRQREAGTGAHLPVIALSASALPEDIQRCRSAGMDDFLAKPVRMQELDAKLQEYLPLSGARAGGAMSLGLLEEAFGGPEQAREVIGRLLESCRSDLALLESAMGRGDRAEEEHLLHRCEGALRLVSAGSVEPNIDPADLTARRSHIERSISELERSLAS